MSDDERLLILDAANAGDPLLDLAEGVSIVSRMPPSIAVIKGSDESLAAVATRPGVAHSLERGEAPTALGGLSEAARLFVRGWLAEPAPEPRPGDGLSWDAPGYSPPM